MTNQPSVSQHGGRSPHSRGLLLLLLLLLTSNAVTIFLQIPLLIFIPIYSSFSFTYHHNNIISLSSLLLWILMLVYISQLLNIKQKNSTSKIYFCISPRNDDHKISSSSSPHSTTPSLPHLSTPTFLTLACPSGGKGVRHLNTSRQTNAWAPSVYVKLNWIVKYCLTAVVWSFVYKVNILEPARNSV